ncbi:ABC transporter ATP-binding protein [Ktedonobacter robiniae]|uniref:Helicase n=1 Tax=Ktedonobacter robiniae TaxID=2778365 RepID=A0ABQ3UYG6_9CHLR|nr:ABC transporter ATP-binding protein [Ktedonobacter robiniae]GHO57402.1 helicase [Ktedonobacter robiniae]
MKFWQFLLSLKARNSPPRVTSRQYLTLLRTYLGPQRLRVAAMALLLFASIAMQLLGPQIIRVFIDAFQYGATQQVLTLTALLYLGVAIGGRLVSALAAYFCEDVGWRATNWLREDLTRHCLNLDRAFHSRYTPGELIERVDGNVDSLANFFSRLMVLVLGNALLVLGILVLMARENAWLGIVMGLYLVVSIFAYVRIQKFAIPYYKKHQQAEAVLSGFWGELLASLEDIASSGAAPYILRRYVQLQRQENSAELKRTFYWTSFETSGLAIEVVSMIAVLIFSVYLFMHGSITLGTLVLLLSYNSLMLDYTFELTEQFSALQEATASIERINEIYHTASQVPDGPGVSFPPGALDIAFQAVNFHYEPSQPVLLDISFEVPAGMTVGLIGRSGSGKTSLTRLLMRFYDPVVGSVCLGGQNLRQARLEDLRQRVGLVTQEVQLFRATLRENLTFFDERIDDERILAAITRLGLYDWYTRLPNGLDTPLASNGAGLSAGEAQLLACIRVFLKDPQLVILDEATSRLDPATERLITQATERLLRGRTALIIAHRLSTVERVERIMVLEAGQIVEYGARANLAGDPTSLYAQLLQMMHPEELLA